jgi:hypothetical protein
MFTDGDRGDLRVDVQHHVPVHVHDVVAQRALVVHEEVDRVHALDLARAGVVYIEMINEQKDDI